MRNEMKWDEMGWDEMRWDERWSPTKSASLVVNAFCLLVEPDGFHYCDKCIPNDTFNIYNSIVKNKTKKKLLLHILKYLHYKEIQFLE